jgi:hypothetical protein
MTRWAVLLAAGLGCVLGTRVAAQETKKFSYVDLQTKANKKLTDNLGNLDGTNLSMLPKGEQTLEGVKFKIADRFIRLGSSWVKTETKPERVEGIPVGKAFAKLHLLHATVAGGPRGGEVADDTEIAKYTVHYEGGTTETIPVVYGKDVRDFWWYSADKDGVTRGKVAWKGENEATKTSGGEFRLYLSTWENPHPTKKIVSIDYMRVGDTVCAPFCVAMTLEEK